MGGHRDTTKTKGPAQKSVSLFKEKKKKKQDLDCHSAIKKNELMPLAATWMDREIVIPSEASQTENEKYPITSLIDGI